MKVIMTAGRLKGQVGEIRGDLKERLNGYCGPKAKGMFKFKNAGGHEVAVWTRLDRLREITPMEEIMLEVTK